MFKTQKLLLGGFILILGLTSTISQEIPILQNTLGFCDSVNPSTCEGNYTFQPVYSFNEPELAYKVLTRLDVLVPIENKYLGSSPKAKPKYDQPYLGLTNDPEYCNKHRAMFVETPEVVFNKKNVFIEARAGTLADAIDEIGKDIMPHIGGHMAASKKEKRIYDLRPDINVFFAARALHKFKHLGEHFACLSQEYNHIPGHESLKRKDTVAISAINYANKFKGREHCFNFDQYFPKTWFLSQEDSCKEFFSVLGTEEHKKLLDERQIVFIEKVVNSHKGNGVTPVNARYEEILKKRYKNGDLCGQSDEGKIVQNYIHNPLLLHGRKFDFRTYMLIASTNPLMVFYNDGFLRVSLFEYDPKSNDKQVLLTNLALNDNIYSQVRQGKLYNGMNEEDLKLAQQWTFDRLQAYLLSTGVISDPNWLDNYLRPELKKAIIHLVRMSSHTFLKRSNLYELYGVDFLLDSDLKLWFIEANATPVLAGYSEPLEKQIKQMVKDHFEIVLGLTKSRMKRVIMLVNKIISQGEAKEKKSGEIMLVNLNKWRKEFKEITRNYFEPEFQPSPGNSYSKIIDDNLSGKDRYSGLIDESCL